MTWVKVCGLRRERDVAAALEAGADAVGFVLAAQSPRRVTESRAWALAQDLPMLSVIVTADLTPDELMAAVAATGVGGVQPHGHHQRDAAAAAQQEGLFVLYPVSMRGPVDLSEVSEGQTPLLDTYRAGVHGGTGEPFDWELIPDHGRPYVLAGGLGPDNIEEAIRQAAPWGVDASSGLESSPGVKDPDRIREFVERVRAR
ncbi:MAG: phosphoribosylanthranilate isomerase [Acidimicrobiia bacterium]|nr:phosphoribosylanthranilate isomerase [Acidimicrobiia bacterium]MDH3397936.1 phosphoribosylanthranilate isomerase [Acidimicrobiia bacterium]